jgi:DNA-binding beta-propeller fold protein YncE
MDHPKGEDMRLLTVFLTLLLTLTACAAPAGNVPITPPPDPTTAPVKPTTSPADGVPESHDPDVKVTLESSLLATEWKGKSKGNILFPLDPASGAALPGYTPISLGYFSFHVFSPDRRTLAVVSFPNDNAYNGSLLLIDLPAWKTQKFELKLDGWASAMGFSSDGKRLAIAHGESNYKLTIVNVEKGVITAQGQADSFVTHLKFTESGEALMLYSPTINTTNGLSGGAPQVILLDVADLSLRWSAELEDVRDGVFPKDENVTPANIHEPGQAFYINPGLAFAPDQDVLYIVHADSEQLSTVDFNAHKVETVEIHTKLTWFERLLSLTASVAYAKIGDGIIRQAAVSPDGQYLYVVGVNNATFQDQQGNSQMEQTPLGLEIIQTSDGSRVERFETDTTELSLSPDGRFLYLRSWGPDIPWTEVFDIANRQLITRKENSFATPALLMNGDFLLVSTYSTSETTHHMSVLEPDGLRLLSDWTGSNYIYLLTTP